MIPSHLSDLPNHSEEFQLEFFDAVLDRAHRACAADNAIVHDVVIAGTRIRFVFSGPALESQLFPAISHRQAPLPASPDVTLYVWDSASTGVAMAPPPVQRYCFTERGDIWTFNSRRVRSAFLFSEFSLNLFDHTRNIGVCWFNSAEGLPYWTQASPFRALFHWIFSVRGAHLIHAAAIASSDGGILLTGRGGVGKSTTALSCASAGFSYVGDDYVLLVGGERVEAHSLYRTAKIEPAAMDRFAQFAPRLLGVGAVAGPVKAVASLDTGVSLSAPVDAVLQPVFGKGAETRFEPADFSQLLGAATLTTLAQLPHADKGTVDFIERQLMRVDCAKIVLGNDTARVPPAIAQFLAGPRANYRAARAGRDLGLISVVMPVYNAARFVAEGVRSILAQRYSKIEFIIVDDGSTDDIDAVVSMLPVEARFVRQPNRGPAAARNAGLQRASGDLIAFLDADDLWPEGRLSNLLSALVERPECHVVMGRAQLMEQTPAGAFEFVGNPAESFKYYIGAGLYRRRAFEVNGVFDVALRYGEDLDWFANVAATGTRVVWIDAVTLYVRRHASNMTRNKTGPEINSVQLLRNALQRKRLGNVGRPD